MDQIKKVTWITIKGKQNGKMILVNMQEVYLPMVDEKDRKSESYKSNININFC